MRFRTGVIVGLGLGYYFGAKAGRERYEQLRKMMDKAGPGVTKVRAAVELGVERLRDMAEPQPEPEPDGLEPMLRPSSN
jgi:hypothetical protein